MHPRIVRTLALTFALALAPSAALAATAFSINSPLVGPNREMSVLPTCDGKGASPPLSWSAPPSGTKSLALIVTDRDSPGRPFVHWLVYDIPPTVRRSEMGLAPPGSRLGYNSRKRVRWAIPCPSRGVHHYVFTLYALDTELRLTKPTEGEVRRAMRGHVLGQARMVATYERPQGQQ
jgi:Raf kinase inhibitor-like YbhB/YbcL family protein